MDHVGLRSAFSWECPKCKKRQFSEAFDGNVPQEIAEKLDFRASVDICFDAVPDYTVDQNHVSSEFLVTRIALGPPIVQCEGCKTRYLTYCEYTSEYEEGKFDVDG